MAILCPHCGKRFKRPAIPVERWPRSVRCKACQKVFDLRRAAEQAEKRESDRVEVRCGHCGKTYRIARDRLPTGEFKARCKTCGGVVRLDGSGPEKTSGVAATGARAGDERAAVGRIFGSADWNDDGDSLAGSSLASLDDLANGGTSATELLPLAEAVEEEPAAPGASEVSVDFDKVIRLVKVLGAVALGIVIVGMTFTHVRRLIERHLEARAAESPPAMWLESSRSATPTPPSTATPPAGGPSASDGNLPADP